MEVGELLPRLSILTAPRDGGLFLLPFSGGYPRLTLSVILPCDARTFLTRIPFGMIPRGRPTRLPVYYITFFSISQDKIFSPSAPGGGGEYFCGFGKLPLATEAIICYNGRNKRR